jgi:hypothetical protein
MYLYVFITLFVQIYHAYSSAKHYLEASSSLATDVFRLTYLHEAYDESCGSLRREKQAFSYCIKGYAGGPVCPAVRWY